MGAASGGGFTFVDSWKAPERDFVWAIFCNGFPCCHGVDVDLWDTHGTCCVSPLGRRLERGLSGRRRGSLCTKLRENQLEGEGEGRVCSRCNRLFFSLVSRSHVPANRRASCGAPPPGAAALRRPVLRVSRSHERGFCHPQSLKLQPEEFSPASVSRHVSRYRAGRSPTENSKRLAWRPRCNNPGAGGRPHRERETENFLRKLAHSLASTRRKGGRGTWEPRKCVRGRVGWGRRAFPNLFAGEGGVKMQQQDALLIIIHTFLNDLRPFCPRRVLHLRGHI